tara:strand:- start:182 stop:433 length:252 start_codon:yes stop_codon:yes gene_type:complete
LTDLKKKIIKLNVVVYAEVVMESTETFEEITELSKKHGIEMFQQSDEAHLKVISEMEELMNDSKAMKEWMENKRKKFDELSED